VRCALFRRGDQARTLKNGMQVLLLARVSLYEARGDFQLIVNSIEEVGEGALRRAFEQLKDKLLAQGLFDAKYKKPLPKLPRCIGVVTSPSGAALRDILSVLKRRFAVINIIIYPALVQGERAAESMARMIELANQRQECDILLIARGGGSLEDLWSFNEEKVARAIYNSHIPTVSGIGHETDITIADFVVDQRAATPSAAAELASPDQGEWLSIIYTIHTRLLQLLFQQLRYFKATIEQLEKRLPHPQKRLRLQTQQLSQLQQRLKLAQNHYLRHQQAKLWQSTLSLQQQTPSYLLSQALADCRTLENRLSLQVKLHCDQAKQLLQHQAKRLNDISPLNTLERGYAIASHAGNIISNSDHVCIGDLLQLRLAKGGLDCRVEKVQKDTL